jgi:hypothetical protein
MSKPIPAKQAAGAISELCGIPRPVGHDLLLKAGLPTKGQLDTREGIRAIVEQLRARSDRSRNPEVRNRTDEANMKTAELNAAEKAGELAPIGIALDAARDFMVKVRQVLASAHQIPAKDRDWLAKKLREIKVEA